MSESDEYDEPSPPTPRTQKCVDESIAIMNGDYDSVYERPNRIQLLFVRYNLLHPMNRFTFVMALVALIDKPLGLWYPTDWLFWTGLVLACALALFL